jgi:hypothetical protein
MAHATLLTQLTSIAFVQLEDIVKSVLPHKSLAKEDITTKKSVKRLSMTAPSATLVGIVQVKPSLPNQANVQQVTIVLWMMKREALP